MHSTVIGWVIYGGRHCRRVKIIYLSQPGIEPRSLDLQANTLPRRCKSRLLRQGSRSVLYIPRPCDKWIRWFENYVIINKRDPSILESYFKCIVKGAQRFRGLR